MTATTTTATGDVIASCSFCAKPNTEIERLVAGPGVLICNECVDLSATIIAATAGEAPGKSARRRAEYLDRSAEDMLSLLPALARSAAQVEADMARWVVRLRDKGTDWSTIASALGISVGAARHRFETRPGSWQSGSEG
ncbi:MAG: ClpX C4-type zinc finger protein [Acidimicrobiales bacterium]